MAQVNENIQRQLWIDQYRGILFFFVIVFHTFQSPLWLRHFFDFFFLPGFFFLSGYLFKTKGLKNNIIGIINGLLIPFFIFSIIISVYNMIVTRNALTFFCVFIDYFVMGGDGIWFIPCLIVTEIIFTLIVNIFNKFEFNIVVLISLCTFILTYIIVDGNPHHLPWNLDTCIIALSIFSVGNLVREFEKLPKLLTFISFVFYIALSQLVGNSMYVEVDVDLHNNIIGEPFVYIILSLIGSYSLFSLCRIIPVLWFFSKLGQYTLFSFPFHPFVYRTMVKTLILLGRPGGGVFCDILLAPLLTGFTLIVVCAILEKYAPFLIGKYKYFEIKL